MTPELILAVSLFLLFLNAFRVIGLGTTAQLIGLVVLALAYPVVIVRARLLSLGDSFEEAAMDLGASPVRTLARHVAAARPLDLRERGRRLRLLARRLRHREPAVARFVEPDRGDGHLRRPRGRSRRPATNAIGTLMLTASTLIIAIAAIVYRRSARRTGDTGNALTT